MRRILLLLVAVWVDSAPLPYNPHDVDAAIEHFLGDLYDRMQQSQKDIYDQMQGDQPQNLDGDFVKLLANNFTAANVNNMTDYFRTSRNRSVLIYKNILFSEFHIFLIFLFPAQTAGSRYRRQVK